MSTLQIELHWENQQDLESFFKATRDSRLRTPDSELELNYSFFLWNSRHIIFLEDLFGEVEIIHRALAVCIVENDWLAHTGCFAEAGIAVDDGAEDQFFKMTSYFGYYLITETKTAIIHGHQNSFNDQRSIETALNDLDGI